MKKTIFLVAALSALIAMFVGCSFSSNSENSTNDSSNPIGDPGDPADPIDPKGNLASPIGEKQPSVAKAVGDIVFSDGSASPYTATLTEDQKSKAIAVIFYVGGTGLNSGDDTTTSRTLGVGLKHSQQAWCTSGSSSANAYSKDITTIQCPSTGSTGSYTFTGDKNGSGNLAQIGAFLAANESTNDTGTAAKYPAFYFAKNYSTTATNLGTTYGSGWYLPSIAELFEIWKAKATVEAAYAKCDAPSFKTGQFVYYRSSSQSAEAGNNNKADGIDFSNGSLVNINKGSSYWHCAIRAFN